MLFYSDSTARGVHELELDLAGKSALVTGADRGTGQVIAQALAAEGVRVLLHGASEESATAAVACLEHSASKDGTTEATTIPTHAAPLWGDLASASGCADIAEQALAAGPVDILVNNYGTASRGKWQTVTEADWLDMYQKNVLSAARLAQALVPGMTERGWGRVIQLGTIGSHQPNAIMPHYYSAKGALATLSASLALEVAGSGITVNTVSPGLIHTEELEAAYRAKAAKRGWGEAWEQILHRLVAEDFPNPVGRIATRQEVADFVVFLCSPKAGFIHGQNIRVDGGAVRYV